MSPEEIQLSIITLIISTVCNVVSIIVNCYQTYKQQKSEKEIKVFEKKQGVLIEYYLPVKYLLTKIKAAYIKSKKLDENFNIFELYNQNSALKKERDNIMQLYQEYVSLHNKLKAQYADAFIDSKLNRVYSHIIIVLTFKNDINLLDYSREYEMPDIVEIINKIDEYARRYKLYENKIEDQNDYNKSKSNRMIKLLGITFVFLIGLLVLIVFYGKK